MAFNPSAYNLTPAAGAVSVVTTAGTAVTAVQGPINGGFITNPLSATDQGIGAAEGLTVNFVTTATNAGNNGSQLLLAAGATIALPALGPSGKVSVNALTSGHKFTVVIW